jgi:hypothetical protein
MGCGLADAVRSARPKGKKMSIKILIPKEHGVWAILILPYCVGVAIGGGVSGRVILGLIGILLLFLSRRPFFLLLKQGLFKNRSLNFQKKDLQKSFCLYSGAGAGLLLWLLIRYRLWDLIMLGLMALVLFLVHTFLALQRKERTVIGELLGVGLLTLSAPVGFVLSGGKLVSEAFILWLLNVFYFAGSIFYIKMRKKAVLGEKRALIFPHNINLVKECLAYILLLMIILLLFLFAGVVPVLMLVAFVPMVVHTMWSIVVLRPEFKIIKQGFIQTYLSLIYSVLLVISWK